MDFIFSILFLMSGFTGVVLSGGWTFFPLILATVAIPLTDALTPADRNRPSRLPSLWFDFLLYVYFILHFLLLACTVWKVARPETTFAECLGFTLSTGLLFGSLGFTYAHEMIHRPRVWRWMGEIILISLNYGPYSVSHLQCHHRWVGTPNDPMTARRGQSLYSFWLQAIPGALRFCWKTTRRRWLYFGASFALSAIILAYGGWLALAFYWAQSCLAILLLVGGDYIEHYGLTRSEVSPNRFEAIEARHSWDSHHWFSGKIFLHLQRHADHHLHAARPYQNLILRENGQVLPASFPAMILLAFFPPLFKRVMERHLSIHK